MIPSWLFETDVFDEDIDSIVKEVRRQGMRAEIASYVPMEDGHGYLGLFKPEDCVVYYGSINFAAQVRREAPWIPGVWYDPPKFECVRYYPALAKHLINGDYVMLPYGDMIRQKEFLFGHLGSSDCFFVRPNSGSKLFTGKVIERERYEKDVGYLGFYGAQPHDLVVAAPPKNIDDEWRFVVAAGQPVACSQYRRAGKPWREEGAPREARDLAALAAKEYDPAPVWCLDVCRTRGGEYGLLEIGSVSCSGWYAADHEAIVRAMSDAALKEWKDHQPS